MNQVEAQNQQICKIFNHRWNWIIKENGNTWRTVKRYISDETLIKIYQNPEQIIGLGFGKHSQYLMLDIDINSPYHPQNDRSAIPRIELSLSKIGLTENIKIQSSFSEGIHIYYPLKTKLKSYQLGKKITEYLEAEGFSIKNGTLEIFPNKKKDKYTDNQQQWTIYQRHRLPLQPNSGSHLLDKQNQPIRYPTKIALEEFLQQWEQISQRQDIQSLKTHLYSRKQNQSNTLTIIAQELEAQIQQGFTADAQTNDILLNLGRRIRLSKKIGGIELRDSILCTIKNMKGYQEYCGHHQNIEQRCQDIARWAERNYPLPETKNQQQLPPLKTNNHIKHQDAKTRIINTLDTALVQIFKNVKEFTAFVCKQAKCSLTTLYKHTQLWQGKIQLEVYNTELEKIVCNDRQPEQQSYIYKNITESQEKPVETIQDNNFSPSSPKIENQQENDCNDRQEAELSQLDIDRYILRFYILSLVNSEEIYNKTKQKTACSTQIKQSEGQAEYCQDIGKQSESQTNNERYESKQGESQVLLSSGRSEQSNGQTNSTGLQSLSEILSAQMNRNIRQDVESPSENAPISRENIDKKSPINGNSNKNGQCQSETVFFRGEDVNKNLVNVNRKEEIKSQPQTASINQENVNKNSVNSSQENTQSQLQTASVNRENINKNSVNSSQENTQSQLQTPSVNRKDVNKNLVNVNPQEEIKSQLQTASINQENISKNLVDSSRKDREFSSPIDFVNGEKLEKNNPQKDRESELQTSAVSEENVAKDLEVNLDSQERTKFIEELKAKQLSLPQDLIKLILKATAEQIQNCRLLLEKNKNINNPIGFIIKALKENWKDNQPSTVKKKPSQPSWYAEFEEFYQKAIACGYCEDLPVSFLPTDYRHQPYVRVNKPDLRFKSPYTLLDWRTAKKEFENSQ